MTKPIDMDKLISKAVEWAEKRFGRPVNEDALYERINHGDNPFRAAAIAATTK